MIAVVLLKVGVRFRVTTVNLSLRDLPHFPRVYVAPLLGRLEGGEPGRSPKVKTFRYCHLNFSRIGTLGLRRCPTSVEAGSQLLLERQEEDSRIHGCAAHI